MRFRNLGPLEAWENGRQLQLGPGSFGRARAEAGGAPVAAQAAEVMLDAIARSDGTRSSVTAHVLADSVHGGILGDFTFDRNGDMAPSSVTIYRVQHGGQAIDRVLRVSSQLLR